jgi:hypothetical protein
MRVSQLKPYSIATVAANKPLDSVFIEATPQEDMPMLSGQLTDNVATYEAKGVDSQGQSYQDAMASTATVKAEWLPMGSSNRMTPPDVRRGEQVVLYRFADQDKYYWTTFKDDMKLRKLETVIYAWSGTTDESQDTTAATSYFFEISTHRKLVTFHTAKANGEPCTFDLQFNTGEGTFQLQDDIGNFFYFDAINRVIQMQNVDGSLFVLNQKNVKIVAPEMWEVQAKNGKITIGEQMDIQCPTTNHNGNFNELGAFGLAGDMVTAPGSGGVGTPGQGKIRIAGDTELLGNMDVKGNVTAVTIEASTSITAPNLKYN